MYHCEVDDLYPVSYTHLYPTKEEIAALLKQMKSFDLKPYEDKVSNEPLISEELKGGKIVSDVYKRQPGRAVNEVSQDTRSYKITLFPVYL